MDNLNYCCGKHKIDGVALAQGSLLTVGRRVPLAAHCGAVNADQREVDKRVLGWFTSHDRR
jgi:hypothetical protein